MLRITLFLPILVLAIQGEPDEPLVQIEHKPHPVAFHKLGMLKANLGTAFLITEIPLHRALEEAFYSLHGIDNVAPGTLFQTEHHYTQINHAPNPYLLSAESTLTGIVSACASIGYTPDASHFTTWADGTPREGRAADLARKMLPSNTRPRDGRAAGIGLLIAGGAGVAAALASHAMLSAEMEALKAEARSNTAKINSIAVILEEQQTKVGQLTRTMETQVKKLAAHESRQHAINLLNSLTTSMAQVRNILAPTISALLHGRADPSILLTPEFLPKTMELSRKAAAFDLTLATTRINDLAQLPTTYTLDTATGILTVYNHIPLFSAKYVLALYRASIMPFPAGNGFLEIKTPTDLIAINSRPDTLFFGLTMEQYAACIHSGKYIVCPHPHTVLKQDPKLTGPDNARCLHGLFTGNDRSIKAHCVPQPASEQEIVERAGWNRFAIFTSTPQTVTVHCPGKSWKERISNFSTITLAGVCTAETPAHILIPERRIQHGKDFETLSLPLPNSLVELAQLGNFTQTVMGNADRTVATLQELHKTSQPGVLHEMVLRDPVHGKRSTSLTIFMWLFGIGAASAGAYFGWKKCGGRCANCLPLRHGNRVAEPIAAFQNGHQPHVNVHVNVPSSSSSSNPRNGPNSYPSLGLSDMELQGRNLAGT